MNYNYSSTEDSPRNASVGSFLVWFLFGIASVMIFLGILTS